MSQQEQQGERRNYRRLEDKKLEKIARLIEEENDPKTRILLVTLQCIAEEVVYSRMGLIKTDNIVEQQSVTIKAHSKLMNQAVTVWKIAVYLTGAVNAVMLIAGGYVFNNIDQFKKDVVLLMTTQEYIKNEQKDMRHDLNEHAALFEKLRGIKND